MHYSSAKVHDLIGEAVEASKVALDIDEKYIPLNIITVGRILEDLADCHAHKCRSNFIPGMIVGATIVFAIGAYESVKEKRKKA